VSLATTHTSRAIEELRAQIAPKASDGELAYFAEVCKRLDLSPFADQIVLIGRWDKRANREVHRHQITVAGRRTLASRTGQLAGIEGPQWCGPRINGGPLQWDEVWDDDEHPPYCARVLVHVKEWVTPANGTAKWSEFAQYDKGGMLLPKWRDMPSHMLGKCAESLALRRAFPDILPPDVLDGFARPTDVDAVELEEAVVEVEGDTDGHGAQGEPETASRAHETPAVSPSHTANYTVAGPECERCGTRLTGPVTITATGFVHPECEGEVAGASTPPVEAVEQHQDPPPGAAPATLLDDDPERPF
jgi:hypothetical protein